MLGSLLAGGGSQRCRDTHAWPVHWLSLELGLGGRTWVISCDQAGWEAFLQN